MQHLLYRLPISVRLALWYGLTLLLLLTGFAVFCYTGFHLALHRDFDRHLTHEERELLPYVLVEPDGPSFANLDELTSVAYRTEGIYGTYVRLLSPDGAVKYQSPNFSEYGPLPPDLPRVSEETTISRDWDGLPARTRYVPLSADDAPDAPLAGWLELTGFEWSLHQELHRLRLTLILGVLGSVLLALIGGWWMARRTLRPISAMTMAAGEMGSSDLAARLPADFGTHDELTELAETFNGLLGRLEKSVARERRFTANAAHELLTPLATLRSETEVALQREREAKDYRDALERFGHDVERMTATVQGLLHLARADTITKSPEDRLDLSALINHRVEHAHATAAAKDITIKAEIPPGVAIAAQAPVLAEVIDNILSNAIKYTPAEGHIHVVLSHAEGEALLVVTDTGIGFEPEVGDRLFDRFYRSDEAPVQAERGSGLGLAIAKAIVEGYGGTVHAHSDGPGKGATFEVRLPCLLCSL